MGNKWEKIREIVQIFCLVPHKSRHVDESATPICFMDKDTDNNKSVLKQMAKIMVIAYLSAVCGKGLSVITASLVSVSAPLVVYYALKPCHTKLVLTTFFRMGSNCAQTS